MAPAYQQRHAPQSAEDEIQLGFNAILKALNTNATNIMAVWTTVLHVIDSTAVVMSRCIEFHTLLRRLLHMCSLS